MSGGFCQESDHGVEHHLSLSIREVRSEMHIHILDQYASASGHGLFEPSDNLKVANWDLVCNLDRF